MRGTPPLDAGRPHASSKLRRNSAAKLLLDASVAPAVVGEVEGRHAAGRHGVLRIDADAGAVGVQDGLQADAIAADGRIVGEDGPGKSRRCGIGQWSSRGRRGREGGDRPGRLLDAIPGGQRGGEVPRSPDVIGLDGRGPPEALDRLVGPGGIRQGEAQVDPDARASRGRPQGHPVEFDRPRGIAPSPEEVRQVEQGVGVGPGKTRSAASKQATARSTSPKRWKAVPRLERASA